MASYSLQLRYFDDEPPIYRFVNKSAERFADLPQGHEFSLELLEISKEDVDRAAYFPINRLDYSKMYYFKKLRMVNFSDVSPPFYLTCLFPGFLEISLESVDFKRDENSAYLRWFLQSPILKTLKLEETSFVGDQHAVQEYFNKRHWDVFSWIQRDGIYIDDISDSECIKRFLKNWKDDPNPHKFKNFTIGSYYDSSRYDMLDVLKKFGGKYDCVVKHKSGRLAAHVTFDDDGELSIDVEEATDVSVLTEQELRMMSKEDVIRSFLELQRRVRPQ